LKEVVDRAPTFVVIEFRVRLCRTQMYHEVRNLRPANRNAAALKRVDGPA
jgi:hypothetical protein